MTKSFDMWAEAYRHEEETGDQMSAPAETIIRLFKGDYIPSMPADKTGLKVLDCSFGDGNNLMFLASMGMDAYGTEVHEDIVYQGQARFDKMNLPIKCSVGTNTSLPFDDNFFDFLVSWNVLHYEPTEEGIIAGIAEYARVLKPGGRLILSTTGPDHKILEGAETLGGHRYRIGRDDDFRKGEVFFYFDAPNYVHHYFSKSFNNVEVGRIHDTLFTATVDWFVVTALKP